MTSAPPTIWGNAGVRAENTALRRAMAAIQHRSGKLLEAGCGAGRFVRTIKGLRPDIQAFGCDISQPAITSARTYLDGVDYAVGSMDDLPYRDAQFEMVMVIDVLEHIQNPAVAVAELKRVLKPAGMLHILVPCEGQPATLHWLLWKLGLGADLKERHGSHLQRFTRSGVRKLLTHSGFGVKHVSYSMHPIGQVKDILTYLSREDWFRRARFDNIVFRQMMKALWVLAYLESSVLAGIPACSVVQHITVVRSDDR